MRMAFFDQRRRPRRDEAVALTGLEQRRNGRTGRRIVEPHPGRQLDADLFRSAGLFDTATNPMDIGALDAVIVLKKSPRPDIRGQLIFRYADFAALEILRLLDPVGADVDRGMPEGARNESWHGDIATVVLRGLDRVAR